MSKTLRKTAAVIIVLFGILGCTVTVHDEDKAAAVAEDFANTAFVKQDFRWAYRLFSESLRAMTTKDQAVEIMEKMHPHGYPTSVKANEYAMVPGQDAVMVFVDGENEEGKFCYDFLMVGTALRGYQIQQVLRVPSPRPPVKGRISLKK